MYKTNRESIPVPSVKGIKLCQKKYVYYASKFWCDTDQKSARDNRRAIGKLDTDREGYMFPNDVYYELFSEEEELSLPADRSDSLSFVNWTVLEQAADLTGCLTALQNAFPDDWKQILSLAVNAICG